jgi:small-conductance mechanosensitive channel
MRKTVHWLLAVLLLGLVGFAIVGLWLTSAPVTSSLPAGLAATNPIDEKPLTTARGLASLAQTPEERALSGAALRLADHEIDLEFAQALRDAARQPPRVTPLTIRLQKRVKATQARVDAEQAAVARYTRLAKESRGVAQVKYQSRLELAKEELSLDQDELKDAKRSLLIVGGNRVAQLQQLLSEHEKSANDETEQGHSGSGAKNTASTSPTALSHAPSGPSLLAHLRAWEAVQQEENKVAKARAAALALAATFQQKHDELERKVQAEQAKTLAPAKKKSAGTSPALAASTLSSVRQLKDYQEDISSFDRQIETERALANVFGRWETAVQAGADGALHRLIQSVLWVLVLLLLAVVADLLISHLFSGLSFDRKRLHTMHSVLRFTTRAIAAILILIVIFGPPKQLGTMVGLVGAGLAVALKDFIVAFLGWFRLIGPNGMRPGDWVEINGAQQINGVQGKVLEVGLLFTVILEAGNWTDAGHPTGRRVAFINSFAIEGYYFNFTTAGQWLWDEIEFGLPASLKARPVLEALQQAVERETEGNAHLAEHDWKDAMSGSGLAAFSAKPVITVRPTETGLNVVIRYITRADEREEQRQKLFHVALEVLRTAGTFVEEPAETSPHPEPA